MRMSQKNQAKYDALRAVLGMTDVEAKAVIYPKMAARTPKAKAPAPLPPLPTPVEILMAEGQFTREEAEALVAAKPVVEKVLTPEEVRTAAVAEQGFVFVKSGRIYLTEAIIEAALDLKDGDFRIVPNAQGKGAVLVYFQEGNLALSPLYVRVK